MLLEVKRFKFEPTYTVGKLFIDGVYECYTLEDVVRPKTEQKVYGATAIPEGTYLLEVNYSPKYKKDLPYVRDVPGFEGIRIHSGNTSLDTDGCILVGKFWEGGDYITQSRVAFGSLFDKLKVALAKNQQLQIKLTNK
jgi:hypothetical protein